MPSASDRQAVTKNQAPHRKSLWAILRTDVQVVEYRSTSSLPTFSRHYSGTPVMVIDLSMNPTDAVSLLIANMDLLSTIDGAPFCRVYRQENCPTSQCPFIPDDHREHFNKLRENSCKPYVSATNVTQTNELEEKGNLSVEVTVVVRHKTQQHP